MEIRILQETELANAAGLSRYVFDTCLRNRMEFVQTIGFVEDYLKVENLEILCREKKLTVWGLFEQEQMVGVAGLQSDGMITLLYVLPQCTGRGYGAALIDQMRSFAKGMYNLSQIGINAAPAWTSGYFVRKGFTYVSKPQDFHVPYIAMRTSTEENPIFRKKHVPAKVIAGAIAGCLLFATAVCVGFLIYYIR